MGSACFSSATTSTWFACFCDDLVVLQGGRVVEAGPAAAIFAAPQAAYTRELLEAIPYFEPNPTQLAVA